jgi:cellulose synthase (UDP-forming)
MKKLLNSLYSLVIPFLILYIIFRIYTLFLSYVVLESKIEIIVVFFFFLAEIFIVYQSAGYFSNLILAKRNYIRPRLKYSNNYNPKVTIVIPVYNEPQWLLNRTIQSINLIEYENKEIVLVDGSDKQKYIKMNKNLCAEQDILYFEVPYPRHGAKAGAINEYLKTIDSKYLVIFDADYRASRDFLKLLVPQMEENEKLAFIQTPQFYGNLINSLTGRAAQMQQSIFYEYISEAKSLQNSAFMCGTNLIIRISALNAVGGFDEKSITEDFATSLKMHMNGWQSEYYNYTTAFGNAPGNLSQYFKQQYRWGKGNLDIFRNNFSEIFFTKKLTLTQKVSYFLSSSYYFIGVAKTMMIIMPLLFIFFRVPSYVGRADLYLLTFIPYFLSSASLFIDSMIIRKYKASLWLLGESLTFLTFPTFIRAFIDSLLGIKSKFNTTNKEDINETIPLRIIIIPVILIILHISAITYGIL